jgi:hypothetical protein
MMGEQERTESLFYYFRLEEQIPEDHLLRLLDRYIDFSVRILRHAACVARQAGCGLQGLRR